MGGLGSTRWLNHWNKTLVEDCRKLTISFLKPYLHPGYIGSLTWRRGERTTGSISFQVKGEETPSGLRLIYTIQSRCGEKDDLDYLVSLQSTRTTWGSLRYWFTCPLVVNGLPCRRRVGVLYLPPGGRYFGCRHCYNLTYESTRTKHAYDRFYLQLAAAMQDKYPGITAADIGYMFSGGNGKPPKGYYQRFITWHLNELNNLPTDQGKYAHYLTSAELCAQSGLDSGSLVQLEGARLLLPDHDGKYRPKLVGWGRKLAYLLAHGWEIDEIKRWAKGRWSTPDPRQWPPDRERWE